MPFKPSKFDPKTVDENSKLVLKQQLYAYCVGIWLRWIYDELTGVRVVMSEQHVAITDAKDGDHDGPHRADGAHYQKRGGDWDLFVNVTMADPVGRYVNEGGHAIWRMLGERWESLHPLCRWGGRWGDDNHLSIIHNGVK